MVTVVIELIKNKTQNFKDKHTELGKIPDSPNNILMCNRRIHETHSESEINIWVFLHTFNGFYHLTDVL